MTKRTNFLLILFARGLNLIIGFVFTGLLIERLGMHSYGVFVLMFTILNILFQFNHFHTSILKLLDHKSGYAYAYRRSVACFAMSAVLILSGLLMHSFLLPLLATVLLTVISFIYQAVFYHTGNNGIYNYIIPILNLFLYGGIFIIGDTDYYTFWMVSAVGLAAILIAMAPIFFSRIIRRVRAGRTDGDFLKRADRYVLKRSQQVLFFSGTTIVQTNIDRFIIPALTDMSTLGLYNAVSFVPYRLSMLWGSMSALFSKEVHQGNYNGIKQYFKYGTMLFTAVTVCVLALSTYILKYELKRMPTDIEYAVYAIFVLISLVQSFGFICFLVYSYKNSINKFTYINCFSAILFVVSFFILRYVVSDYLMAIAISIMISKVVELYNGHYISRYLHYNACTLWLKHSLPCMAIIMVYLVYRAIV